MKSLHERLWGGGILELNPEELQYLEGKLPSKGLRLHIQRDDEESTALETARTNYASGKEWSTLTNDTQRPRKNGTEMLPLGLFQGTGLGILTKTLLMVGGAKRVGSIWNAR